MRDHPQCDGAAYRAFLTELFVAGLLQYSGQPLALSEAD